MYALSDLIAFSFLYRIALRPDIFLFDPTARSLKVVGNEK